MSAPFDPLRERLLRAGIAPRHVRRYLRELTEHLADLTAEQRAVGYDEADAAMLASLSAGGLTFADESTQDRVHGNVKARERMIANRRWRAPARASSRTGTDHAAESLMGFSRSSATAAPTCCRSRA